MFASLQTLQRPNGMGPHGLLGLRGLGALGASDWQLAYCTDANGTSVLCDYSQSLSQSWNDSACDPDKSAAAGVCTDSDGNMVPNVPAITSVNSLASGAALSPAAHPVTTVIVPAAGAQANPLGSKATPVGGTQVIPAQCAQTLMAGICDTTLYVGLAGFAALVVLMKVGR